jgi:two-component system, chemotaxis family, sensor kinase CheA
MTPLLEQFLSESSEFSHGIGEKLMQLEESPNDRDAMDELFRLMHTLKGNSGLFTFPEMTRVLHAGEDLLGMVRSGEIAYSRQLADHLLEAMDFVMVLCGDIESTESINASRAEDSIRMAEALRALMPEVVKPHDSGGGLSQAPGLRSSGGAIPLNPSPPLFDVIPENIRLEAVLLSQGGTGLHWVVYSPEPECFFQGDDPFHRARQTPGLLWGCARQREPIPPLLELDTYRCVLGFYLLTGAPREELAQYFRYMPDQAPILAVDPQWLELAVPAQAKRLDSPASLVRDGNDDILSESASSETGPTSSRLSAEKAAALDAILSNQQKILLLHDRPNWGVGRVKAVASVLTNVSRSIGDGSGAARIEAALAKALASGKNAPLLEWLHAWNFERLAVVEIEEKQASKHVSQTDALILPLESQTSGRAEHGSATPVQEINPTQPPPEDGIKFGRRAEDSYSGPKSLKVDQAKIDLLMNLIGELVVSKNALPYLAQRAEEQYGVRELSREIKSQYAVINRIADEMQGAIMQVRMMAVSFVFQRFPRLVRDISRKLGKEVQLVLEGEQTEADKNIVESLADPLIHIVRNSLDHGIETPDVRRACGKPETGTITIRASQESDTVVIEVIDDGKGIDPVVIKRKAYEKGLIDEATLERMSDQEAINLIFAAGLSTTEVVSDLSGRGVGMDVVRSAVNKINGSVLIESELGRGTTIRISLPLSMAVTQAMIVESDGQLFGVPMDHVVETVRVPRAAIHWIKQSMTAILRGRVIPLKSMNHVLGVSAPPRANEDDELAVLLVHSGGEILGLLVDSFKETLGLIQKPLGGVLSGLSAYSGSALLGDGSVLMILNIGEIV